MLALFGLIRSDAALRVTVESLRLLQADVVAVHAYCYPPYCHLNYTRAALAAVEWQDASIETEQPPKPRIPVACLKSQQDTKATPYIHYAYALRSCLAALGMLRARIESAALVAVARIDVIFLPPTPHLNSWLDVLQRAQLVVPDWENWTGVNDRFVVGRGRDVLAFVRERHRILLNQTGSTCYMAEILACLATINLNLTTAFDPNVRFKRIRQDLRSTSVDDAVMNPEHKIQGWQRRHNLGCQQLACSAKSEVQSYGHPIRLCHRVPGREQAVI